MSDTFNKRVLDLEPGDLISVPYEGDDLSLSFAILEKRVVEDKVTFVISDSTCYTDAPNTSSAELYIAQEGNPFTWDTETGKLHDCFRRHADWFTEKMVVHTRGAQEALQTYHEIPRFVRSPINDLEYRSFCESDAGVELTQVLYGLIHSASVNNQNTQINDVHHVASAVLEMLGLKPDLKRVHIVSLLVVMYAEMRVLEQAHLTAVLTETNMDRSTRH